MQRVLRPSTRPHANRGRTVIFDLNDIAEKIGASIHWPGGKAIQVTIDSIAPVQTAAKGQLTFVANAEYTRFVPVTAAAAIILKEARSDCTVPQLIAKNPYVAFARAAQLFAPARIESGVISSAAYVAPSVNCGRSVTIYPHCYVADGVVLGDRVALYPGVYVGPDVVIGDDSVVFPNAVIMERCRIGQRVIIHAGTVIGADGFGFAPGEGTIHKIPQVGIVVIEDDVELGAACTVDRAALGETRIKRGTKLDSKVHIGHNAVIGEHCLFAAHTAVAGSARVGDWVMAGGHSGIAGHLEVGDRVQIGAMTGVIKDAIANETYLGFPAIPASEWRRQQVHLRRLAGYEKRIKELEARLEKVDRLLP